MIATDTYADYDGYTIYTTKRASAAPQPKWPELNADYMLQVRRRCQQSPMPAHNTLNPSKQAKHRPVAKPDSPARHVHALLTVTCPCELQESA